MGRDQNPESSLDRNSEAASLGSRQLVVHEDERFSVSSCQRQNLSFSGIKLADRNIGGKDGF